MPGLAIPPTGSPGSNASGLFAETGIQTAQVSRLLRVFACSLRPCRDVCVTGRGRIG